MIVVSIRHCAFRATTGFSGELDDVRQTSFRPLLMHIPVQDTEAKSCFEVHTSEETLAFIPVHRLRAGLSLTHLDVTGTKSSDDTRQPLASSSRITSRDGVLVHCCSPEHKGVIVERTVRTTQHFHFDRPIHAFAIKQWFQKMRLSVRDVKKDAIGFQNTKHLRGT